MEIEKFNGDSLQWVQFWGSFEKTHNDKKVSDDEEMRFLRQSMEKNSRTYEVINSYPRGGKYYKAAFESLKTRFGRDDLLVDVYMRELHKIVSSKPDTFTAVYDKLEAHIRALDTLGITSDMCAAMHFLLIESLLPEEVLQTWSCNMNQFKTTKERLQGLMKFLEAEVQNEEWITLARTGFSLSTQQSAEKGNRLIMT